MRGFTERALVLFSDANAFDEATSSYRFQYRQAVQNLLTYLEDMGIAYDVLITDPMSWRVTTPSARWLATAVPGDLFFMRSYCGLPDYQLIPLSEDLATVVTTKYKIPRGLTPEERYPIVAKRVKHAEKAIIDSYDFVIVFGNTYKVKTSETDGRAVLKINANTFIPTLTLSGAPVPLIHFLQVPYGNISLCDWGKYRGQ